MERMIMTLSLRALGHALDTSALSRELSRLPGVLDATVDGDAGVVHLEVDPGRFTFRRLRPGLARSRRPIV